MFQSLSTGPLPEALESSVTQNQVDLLLSRSMLKMPESIDAVYALGVLRHLDPAGLIDSPWCRTETLDQQDLEELMADISRAGTNEIPVLVHTKKCDGKLEVIYGARRVQACRQLGIPVLAQYIDCEINAVTVFHLQDVENRIRSSVSAYEYAMKYNKALSTGLFPSQNMLAKAIGKTQPWISNLLPMANLPLEVVHAFDRLNDLQPAHAKEIFKALSVDAHGVISRANQFATMRDTKKMRSAKETMRFLLGSNETTDQDWFPLNHRGREVGRWKCNGKDETTVRIPRKLDLDEITAIAKIADATAQDMDGDHKLLIGSKRVRSNSDASGT